MANFFSILPNVNNKIPYMTRFSLIIQMILYKIWHVLKERCPFNIIKASSTDTSHFGAYTLLNLALYDPA
jgi:hypothetical protein